MTTTGPKTAADWPKNDADRAIEAHEILKQPGTWAEIGAKLRALFAAPPPRERDELAETRAGLLRLVADVVYWTSAGSTPESNRAAIMQLMQSERELAAKGGR